VQPASPTVANKKLNATESNSSEVLCCHSKGTFSTPSIMKVSTFLHYSSFYKVCKLWHTWHSPLPTSVLLWVYSLKVNSEISNFLFETYEQSSNWWTVHNVTCFRHTTCDKHDNSLQQMLNNLLSVLTSASSCNLHRL